MLPSHIQVVIGTMPWPKFRIFIARLGFAEQGFSVDDSWRDRLSTFEAQAKVSGISDDTIRAELLRLPELVPKQELVSFEALKGIVQALPPAAFAELVHKLGLPSDAFAPDQLPDEQWKSLLHGFQLRLVQPSELKASLGEIVTDDVWATMVKANEAAWPVSPPPASAAIEPLPGATTLAQAPKSKPAIAKKPAVAKPVHAVNPVKKAAPVAKVKKAKAAPHKKKPAVSTPAESVATTLPPPSGPSLEKPGINPAGSSPPTIYQVFGMDERFKDLLAAGQLVVTDIENRLEFLRKVDTRALYDAAYLASLKKDPAIDSSHLLGGYFMAGGKSAEFSVDALVAVAWESCLNRHPERSPNGTQEEIFMMISSGGLHLSSPPTLRRRTMPISPGLGRLLWRSFELAAEPPFNRRPYTTTLLLCLLGPREWHLDPEGTAGMAAFDFDFPTVRRDFFERIKGRDVPELAKELPEFDTTQMADLLGLEDVAQPPDDDGDPDKDSDEEAATAAPADNGYRAGAAGFNSEYCRVGGPDELPDHLGVQGLAHRLAELMTLRETKMPLAVGLFGNWGSGKSHFMTLMDQHMRALARRPAAAGKGPWCQEIVPIYFNAWHYIDTNLWASLVTEIFDRLFRHVAPVTDPVEERKKKVEKLMRQLQKAKGAAAEAEEELELTEAAKEQAEEERKLAETEADRTARLRDNRQAAVNGMLDNLGKLVPDQDLEKGWAAALGALCPPDARSSYRALRTQVAQWRGLTGRLRAVGRALWAKEGRARRIWWLAGALIGAPLLTLLYQQLAAHWKDMLPQIHLWVGWVTAVATWSGVQLRRGLKMVSQIEDFEKKSRAARKKVEETPRLKAARRAVARWEAKEEEANLRAREARAKVKRIQVELGELRPERRLFRFIEQRAQSPDYRNHLGLVSLVRRDFNELSDYFRGADKDSPAAPDGGRLRHIDRIVLYVDDLDRCQPEKVVDVLQAVHLLLAFPLFAVVVGVDQRCLRQSLRLQFSGLMTESAPAPGSPGPNGHALKGMEERPATPLDYLEKIFHVPFHLPDMDGQGFAELMLKLAQPEQAAPPEAAPTGVAARPDPDPAAASPAPPAPPEVEEFLSPVMADDDEPSPAPHPAPAPAQAAESLSDPARAAATGSVQLHPWEALALTQYQPLIRTPRGLKRLLNTYRLVRAGIRKEEWDAYQGDRAAHGEFRVAMLLLAAAAGHPALARGWFQVLRTSSPASLLTPAAGQVDLDPALQQFKQVYDQSLAAATPELTPERWLTWLERVERFAF